MVTYSCEDCGLLFDKKSTYVNHKNRKTACLIEYTKTDDNKYKCNYCDKEYSRTNLVKDHVDSCIEKYKKELEYKNKALEENKKELEELKKMYNNLLSNNQSTTATTTTTPVIPQSIPSNINNDNSIHNSTTNNTTDNSTTNNTTDNSTTINDNSTNTVNNICIIKFGEEDLSKINQQEINKILKSGFMANQESFKLVNCNPRIPEQMNAYITNLRAPYAYVYDGEKFVVKDVNQVLDDIIINRAGDIQELYQKNHTKLSPVQQKSIQGLLKKIKENDKNLINEDKKEIKIAMYNNKESINVPKKLKKK